MKSKKLIAANWKQNGNYKLLSKLVDGFIKKQKLLKIRNDILLLPPSPYLEFIYEKLKKSKSNKIISLGVQNISPYEEGAYTGEISINMINDFKCTYTLVGHSERRHIFKEDNQIIAMKVYQSLKARKKTIICVGETLKEYNKKLTKQVIQQQIKTAFSKSLNLITPNKKNIIIAYEPVWAIGSGKSASINDITNVHDFIRTKMNKIANDKSKSIKIIYGGSVNPKNTNSILKTPNVDGVLVGGASLNLKKFIDICCAI